MESVVHDSGIHIVIKNESCNTVERRHKVLERILCYPESAAVVAEEIIDQWNKFGDRCGRVLL